MDLLTVEESAETLKVSQVTIRRYIADGRLAAVRVGRGVRVRRNDLERLAAPVAPVAPREDGGRVRGPSGAVFTMDDPLWDVVGVGRTGEPTNVADEKDDYLSDAFIPRKA